MNPYLRRIVGSICLVVGGGLFALDVHGHLLRGFLASLVCSVIGNLCLGPIK